MKRWIAVAAMVCAACSKGSTATATATATATPTSTPTPTPTSTPTSTPTPTASVRLLDHGSEPLRPLRYSWHVDQKERMTVELRTTASIVGPAAHQDTVLPPLHIVIALDPQAVTAGGDLQFAWHVLGATADRDTGGASAQTAEAWRRQIVPIERLSGSATVGPDGLSKGVSIDAGSNPTPDAEMVGQVVEMLRDYVAPLPVEPVGKGARWQRVTALHAKNGDATQTDTYTLAEIQGNTGKLDDVVAQTASPKSLPPVVGSDAGAPPERIDSLLTSGTATVAFDLGRIVAQVKFDGTTAMSLSSPSQAMNMVMRLGIVVGGGTR